MIDFSQDYFALFGLPPRYRLEHADLAQLERTYHALQTAVHPDRFAIADESERRLALQSSARVNEAYRALKDPVGRAQYLLSLRGIDALAESDTSLAMDFLERQLERREAVEEARERRDDESLGQLLAAVRAEIGELTPALAAAIESPQTIAGNAGDARSLLRELTFLTKLAVDIESAVADLDEAGATHADLVPGGNNGSGGH